jgi:hypothetical protein
MNTPDIDPEVGEENILIEPGDPDAFEEYDPQPIALHDNGVVIFDPLEFSDKFNCFAAQYSEGVLYVLCKDTRQWRNVEPTKARGFSTVK